MNRRRAITLAIVVAVSLAGCERGDETVAEATVAPSVAATTSDASTSSTAAPATTTSTTSTTTTTTTTSTSAPPAATTTTTAAPATTTTTTTTVPPLTIDGLHLLADGVGPFTFGTTEAELIAALTPLLGATTIDVRNEYPDVTDWGDYLDPDIEEAFARPFGRTVCWANSFCVQFGGDTAAALEFVGWSQGPEPVGVPLATADGITAGSSVADHVDAVEIPDNGCYSQSYGSAHGITVSLLSHGVPFLEFDAAGTPINRTPPPEDLTVTDLQAGELPGFIYADC